MGRTVKLSESLVEEANLHGKIQHRSTPGQIEYWARIGKIADENPDLSFQITKDILTGLGELEAGETTEYEFG